MKSLTIMERVTATIDEETLSAIREVAGPRGVSAFLQRAAQEKLKRLHLLEMLDELDARYGKPSPRTMNAIAKDARRIFRRKG